MRTCRTTPSHAAALALAAVALGSLLMAPSLAAQERDPWLGRDKALHFGATFTLAAGGYAGAAALTQDRPVRLAVGGGLALAAGGGKELYDLARGGDASLRDLTWDLVGTATGLLVAWTVDHFWPRARR